MKREQSIVSRILLMHRRHTTISSLLIVALFVLMANFAYIFITNPDPLISRAGLPIQNGHVYVTLPFAAGNSIEGNDGITKQALGVQAAHQILSGKLPLWNHYEGVGAPLLGETQSAALSPFTLLLVLPYGFLINELVLEVIAGIGMYLFLKHLSNKAGHKIDNTIAITGGCLFGTLGTFMMLPNACFNPIAFLPWSMLAVTLIFSSGSRLFGRDNVGAMLLLSLSVWLSLNAGFPEIAFINTLLVLAYAIILFAKTENRVKLSRVLSLAISGSIAILLALPWLVEFLTYVNPSNGLSGMHNTTILSGLGDTSVYPSSFIPNIIGFDGTNPIYGSIGGFFAVSSILLVAFAICNKNVKLWHKLLFGGWFLIGWLRIVGISIVSKIIAHIPFLGSAAVYRYIPVSMSLCLITLACLGLNEIVKDKKVNRQIFTYITVFVVIFYALILFSGKHYIKSFMLANTKDALFASFFLLLSVLVSAAVLVAISTTWKYKKYFICAVLVLESALCFAIWQFGAYNKGATVNTKSVQFLQQNLQTQRFDSNLLNPNYGSYFNVSELSMMDLPIPTLWGNYINKNIDAYIPSIGYLSNNFSSKRIEQDKQLGVKYLLVSPETVDESVIREEHLSLVYQDEKTEIFELPGYEQYISGDNCLVANGVSFDKFNVRCSKASQLTRLELFYPGWHVKIDGEEVAITKTDNLFQQIYISSGEHTVEFYYWPQFMTLGITGMTVGGIFLLSGAVAYTFIYPRKRNE